MYLSRYPSSKTADFEENEPGPLLTCHKLTPPTIDPPLDHRGAIHPRIVEEMIGEKCA